MKRVLLLLLLVFSCSKKEETVVVDAPLPEINADTETSILIWAWDVAAKGLESTIASFNEKYPNIKVEVVDIGYSGKNQKLSVVLTSGEGMPDIFMQESSSVTVFAESFPHRLLDIKDMYYDGWEGDMDPSQVTTATDTVGRVVAVPWDTGPVVMFYREDFFREAGIDPATIVTWDDFIREGKKFQAAMPGKNMVGFYHTKNPSMWTMMMQSTGNFILNADNELTINSPVSAQSLELIRQMVRTDGLVLDILNWDGTVRAAVDESVATFIMGGWWVGTLIDQAPDQSGKWRIMEMPAMPGYEGRSAGQGGSLLLVSAEDPVKKAASVAFIENALLSVDNQIMMYTDYGLIPSYLPAYEDERMKKGSEYFGGQDISAVFSKAIAAVESDESFTLDGAVITPLETAAYEYATTTDNDIQTTLDETALQIEQATSHKIAPSLK